MDYDAIGALLFIAAIVTSIYLRIRRQKQPRVFIPDYQRGVSYVDGVFTGLLEPGSYRANGSKKQIKVVDMRPRLVVVERLFYQDALQSHSVISIGGQLAVSDAYIATTKLKDQTNDSITIVRDALRATVSKNIAWHSTEAREAAAAEIQKNVRADLENFGMTISNVEITEAWSQPVEPRMISRAN
jgi:hypothetical protein